MNVVEIYDYYFFKTPYRKFNDRCEYCICTNNIVYRRLNSAVIECKQRGHWDKNKPKGYDGKPKQQHEETIGISDVLEYMLYNVSGDTGLPAHYSCCITFYRKVDEKSRINDTTDNYVQSEHVCNAIPIMIGSLLERQLVGRLADMLGVRVSDIYDAEYLHEVYAGSFLVNGTFYYSVFRESNNNKICHNSKSKYRGDETVAYFYDRTCNRGVKLFTDRLGKLRVNDRDGNEVPDVNSDVILQLYKECTRNWRHYTLDMRLITGFFASVKQQGLAGIDDFKNKIYTNYSIGLNTFLDKLPSSAMRNPMWNSSLMIGKINFGISQRLSYPKSKSEAKKQNEQKLKMCTGGMSTGYLVETQRRRNVRKATGGQRTDGKCQNNRKRRIVEDESNQQVKRKMINTATAAHGKVLNPSDETPVQTILGSKDVKMVGLMEKLEQGEKNGPSTFNQVSVSYLPLIRILSNTVQKLQVEHVHAESSKTVPRDAYGFICMKYMGNISTAGKNMLFTDRVQVSYGHVHEIIQAVEAGIERLMCESKRQMLFFDIDSIGGQRLYVVINNAVTSWSVPRQRILIFLLFLKTQCHQYAWMKIIGDYLCVYYYEGVPLLRYERGEAMFDMLQIWIGDGGFEILKGVEYLYFSRDELEILAAIDFDYSGKEVPMTRKELMNKTNSLIDKWFMKSQKCGGYITVDHSSSLAKQIDQFTDYTAPAKRSVSVNARKSACINVYYQKAADLIRGFNIFMDPEGYEKATAKLVEARHGVPDWVTLRDFIRARAEMDNCPQPQDGSDRSVANFYLFRTIFADVAGYNVEDANVIDASVDLCLSYSYSFSLTFVDRTKSGLDIVIPPPRNAVSVCCWDSEGNPTTVLFMVCTIRKKEGEVCGDFNVGDMLRLSQDTRMININQSNNCGYVRRNCSSSEEDTVSFPPFRKLSVIQSGDGNYHVYFMRNDAVLLRSIRRVRHQLGYEGRTFPNMSNAVRLGEDKYAFVSKPEVNPYDVLTSFQTKITTFEANPRERVITVDVRVHGKSDKYDGVKIVNSFGQKGLALVKDLEPYFDVHTPASNNVPIQLVMNNCSFVSRQTIGQFLQMKKNMHAVTTSRAGELVSVGYTAVFFTETEPVTKSCLLRFDEMMRSVIITLGLSIFQNVKSSLDNIYNPFGLLYPPQTRQILSLYRCFGVSYNFPGDKLAPFASKEEVEFLTKIYDVYSKTPKPIKVVGCKALLDILDILKENHQVRRLVDLGVLKEIRTGKTSSTTKRRTFVFRLQGQWINGFNKARRVSGSGVRQHDHELRTYNAREGEYITIYIDGDPSFLTDVLDDEYSLLIDHLTPAHTGTYDGALE